MDPNTRVLDIGCNDGTFAKMLEEKKGCEVVGLDIDEAAVRKASLLGINAHRCDVEFERLPIAEGFDVITCLDVLEHLSKPRILLSRIRNQLRTNGYLVVTQTNEALWKDRLVWLAGRNPHPEHLHVYHWNFYEFRSFISQNGFRIVREDHRHIPNIMDCFGLHFLPNLFVYVSAYRLEPLSLGPN